MLTRRNGLRLLSLALCSSAVAACMPAPSAQRGNRIAPTPTFTPEDEQLVPRTWNETHVKLGETFDGLASLEAIQQLLRPNASIPFITGMTFFAPPEVPLVTIGLYYEKNERNAPAKAILTGGSFALQYISDLDSPLRFDATQIQTVQSQKISSDQLAWFEQHRASIVDGMSASPAGSRLGKTCECNFTTRARPPVGGTAALVITDGNYAGMKVPYTVVAQRLVFVD